MTKKMDVSRKLMLDAHRKCRPRWGTSFNQRIVAPAKHRHIRRSSTRELLDRE